MKWVSKLKFHFDAIPSKPAMQLFISTWEKSYEHIYYSPPHVLLLQETS